MDLIDVIIIMKSTNLHMFAEKIAFFKKNLLIIGSINLTLIYSECSII